MSAMSSLFLDVVFFGQLFLLWPSIFGREQSAFDYYDELVKKRAFVDPAGDEYIESYRHLRENGNAFFIVLFELLLAGVLFYSPIRWVFVLTLWISPAALIWLFGILMEGRDFPNILPFTVTVKEKDRKSTYRVSVQTKPEE
jgi:hypothetical protein